MEGSRRARQGGRPGRAGLHTGPGGAGAERPGLFCCQDGSEIYDQSQGRIVEAYPMLVRGTMGQPGDPGVPVANGALVFVVGILA